MYNEETIKMIQGIQELAKKNLVKDGHIAPVALILRANELLEPCMVTWSNDQEKMYNYAMVGVRIRLLTADSVLLINDVAMRHIPIDKVKEFWNNFETERPLAKPEGGDRIEAICLLHINVVTEEAHSFIQPYRKNAAGKIEFYDVEGAGSGIDTLGEFRKYIIGGYKSGSKAIKAIDEEAKKG